MLHGIIPVLSDIEDSENIYPFEETSASSTHASKSRVASVSTSTCPKRWRCAARCVRETETVIIRRTNHRGSNVCLKMSVTASKSTIRKAFRLRSFGRWRRIDDLEAYRHGSRHSPSLACTEFAGSMYGRIPGQADQAGMLLWS